WRQRQKHGEPAALAELALDRETAAMAVEDVLYDGEAEAGAAQLARTAAIDAIESLGEARDVLGRNALALVGDGHLRRDGRALLARIARRGQAVAAGARDGDDDGGALAPVFHGVVEKVLEHLDELIALAG